MSSHRDAKMKRATARATDEQLERALKKPTTVTGKLAAEVKYWRDWRAERPDQFVPNAVEKIFQVVLMRALLVEDAILEEDLHWLCFAFYQLQGDCDIIYRFHSDRWPEVKRLVRSRPACLIYDTQRVRLSSVCRHLVGVNEALEVKGWAVSIEIDGPQVVRGPGLEAVLAHEYYAEVWDPSAIVMDIWRDTVAMMMKYRKEKESSADAADERRMEDGDGE